MANPQSLSEAILFSSSPDVIRGFFNDLSDEEKKKVANAKDSVGDSPLHFAAFKKKLYVVNMLINYGADVNAQNNVCKTNFKFTTNTWQAGSTPLHKAVLGGAEMVVDELLKHGAQFVDNNNGFSPVDYARRDKALWGVCFPWCFLS